MIRRLVMVLLAGAICLLGTLPVLAKEMRVSQQYNTLEEYQEITGNIIKKFNEAPMLRVKVAAGELPSVEQRLPEEPTVINPVEEIGQYGGLWRMVSVERSNLDWHVGLFIGYEGIVRLAPDYKSVIPNIAKSWDVSADGRVFTFHLRRGMKWSDGMPFTADDIMFWYEEVALNEELTPTFPDWLSTMGIPGKVEKIDDYTVKFVFSKPYGIFIATLAEGGPSRETFLPKHYLKKFHPKYTPIKNLEATVKQAGFDHWFELFNDKNDFWANPERPALYAWRLVVPFGTATQVVLERNPYYWKVDTAGNQFPYIDKIVVSIVTKLEIAEMKGMTGEIDIQGTPVLDNIANYSVFMENSKKGDYRIQIVPVGWNDVAFYFNLNHKDPVLRDIFRDKRFRIAMSQAMDRQKMMELLCPGWDMKIAQVSPAPGSPVYSEQLEKQYTEYDPQKANQLLDEMGLDKRSPDGWRLRPDGQILSFTMEMPTWVLYWIDLSDLITRYWQQVGVKATLKPEDPGLWGIRVQSGEADGTFCGCGDDDGMLLSYREYVPIRQEWGFAFAAPLWALWHQTSGKSGEEPPPEIKKVLELYDEIVVTTDQKKQVELAREIIRINAENFWFGATSRRPGKGVVIKNYVRNVPEYVRGISSLDLAPTNSCQYFFKR